MNLNSQKIWLVVPAAGVGSRMEAAKPKQYLPLAGKTLIETTLEKLLTLDWIQGVIVATSEQDTYWSQTSVSSHPKVIRVCGGKERSCSVLSALQYLRQLFPDEPNIWAMVHDAARPCFSIEKLEALAETAISSNTGAILASRVSDTVKLAKNLKSGGAHIDSTQDRNQLWLAHTPQMFLVNDLISALQYCEENTLPVTDEASAIEHIGGEVLLVQDRRDNIKVTLPEDLTWAEYILTTQKN